METKIVPFNLTKFDVEERTFEGHASIFGNLDDGGDIVHPGAFSKTIQERGHRVKVMWQHNPSEPIGKPLGLQEDAGGLYVKGKISETRRGNDALVLMRDGVVNELSIGYDTIVADYTTIADGQNVRNLREVRLWEISLVTWGMNEMARITAVKEREEGKEMKNEEEKAVVPYQDLPLADEGRAWDAGAARRRVRDWAGGDEVNVRKYRRAFVLMVGEAENLTSYKLPIADIIDGRLTAVPRGIFAAAVVIGGGRGGLDASPEDIAGAKRHLAKYYRKMDREPPWERGESSLDIELELLRSKPEGEEKLAEFLKGLEREEADTSDFGEAMRKRRQEIELLVLEF